MSPVERMERLSAARVRSTAEDCSEPIVEVIVGDGDSELFEYERGELVDYTYHWRNVDGAGVE